MRTSKRDPERRAEKLGYRSGIRGHNAQMCPFKENEAKRAVWMAGWRTGHADYVAGYRQDENIWH